jgi:hypothetical protein
MPYIEFIWDLDDDPEGNVQHLLEHDVTKDEAEEALRHPDAQTTSDSSGRPLTFGYTTTGRYLAVIWEHVLDDPLTVYPITAYDAPEPA